MAKKYKVNENCIGCGLCTGIAPDVFQLGDSGLAEAVAEASDEAAAEEAKESCPAQAIEEE